MCFTNDMSNLDAYSIKPCDIRIIMPDEIAKSVIDVNGYHVGIDVRHPEDWPNGECSIVGMSIVVVPDLPWTTQEHANWMKVKLNRYLQVHKTSAAEILRPVIDRLH